MPLTAVGRCWPVVRSRKHRAIERHAGKMPSCARREHRHSGSYRSGASCGPTDPPRRWRRRLSVTFAPRHVLLLSHATSHVMRCSTARPTGTDVGPGRVMNTGWSRCLRLTHREHALPPRLPISVALDHARTTTTRRGWKLHRPRVTRLFLDIDEGPIPCLTWTSRLIGLLSACAPTHEVIMAPLPQARVFPHVIRTVTSVSRQI